MSTFRARGGGNALHSTIEIPITLTGGIAAVPGSKVMVDKVSLTNPFRAPMLVDEVNFIFWQWAVASQGWGHTQARITIGRQQLTKDFVPVWLMGPSYSHRSDDIGSANTTGNLYNQGYVVNWRFKRPLFVPGREALISELFFPFTESSGVSSYGQVNIAYKCRSLPESTPEPETVDIPYCAAFLGKAQAAGGASNIYTEQSYERDLSNGFGVPLRVDMLTGRIATFVSGASPLGSFDSQDIGGNNPFWNGTAGSTSGIPLNTLCKATSSMGSICVRDSTPFSMLFYSPEHAWPVRTMMPPNGFFKFFFQENWDSGHITATGSPTARVEIGLVGSRRVKVRSVYAQG